MTDRWKRRDLRAPLGMAAISLIGTVALHPGDDAGRSTSGSSSPPSFFLGVVSALWSGGDRGDDPGPGAAAHARLGRRLLFAGGDRHLVRHRPLLGRQGQHRHRLAHRRPAQHAGAGARSRCCCCGWPPAACPRNPRSPPRPRRRRRRTAPAGTAIDECHDRRPAPPTIRFTRNSTTSAARPRTSAISSTSTR